MIYGRVIQSFLFSHMEFERSATVWTSGRNLPFVKLLWDSSGFFTTYLDCHATLLPVSGRVAWRSWLAPLRCSQTCPDSHPFPHSASLLLLSSFRRGQTLLTRATSQASYDITNVPNISNKSTHWLSHASILRSSCQFSRHAIIL